MPTTPADGIGFDVAEDEFLTNITAFQRSEALGQRAPERVTLGGASHFTGAPFVEEGSDVIRHREALAIGDLTPLGTGWFALDLDGQPGPSRVISAVAEKQVRIGFAPNQALACRRWPSTIRLSTGALDAPLAVPVADSRRPAV